MNADQRLRLRIALAAAREREITAALTIAAPEHMRNAMTFPMAATTVGDVIRQLNDANSWENHLGQIDALIQLAEKE